MPDVPASTPDPRDPRQVDLERLVELAVEIERHRYLLRAAAEDYRWRVAQRVAWMEPDDQAMRRAHAERLIEAMMIDPVHHATLDLDAYRAVRDGAPLEFDLERRTYVLRRPGRDPLAVRPGLPEHRLGVIARLAGMGLRLEQIQVVALTTAQPGTRTTRPEAPPEVTRGGTTKSSRRHRSQRMHHADS
ncbi:hypothetical protein F5X71_12200 [Nocardia brasiliensis]|uniref:Uncharacterized protein n=1 Tax=Nocardia brasiliensis TaxID=37326 RepID=A0A6G9XQ64_NOCBR|nr:hypothetical protein [Nocardia brasiliensis]QIS02973.1 hypothetical protein F5X71_12200 [Nocardia brasiliensis]